MGVAVTPVGDGRLEVLLNGEMLFDRKAEGGAYPGLDKVRTMKTTVRERLERVAAAS